MSRMFIGMWSLGRDSYRAPPLLGQDTDAVLAEFGFDADQIAGLRQRGAI